MSNLIRIAILGEIGSRNLGDDLGYFLLRDEIISCMKIRDRMCHVTFCTPARFGELDYSSYECVVTGCGTLLDKQEGSYIRRLSTMQSRGIPTGILGSGWSDEDHLPPTKDGVSLSERVLSAVLKGSWVRGEGAPDLAWVMGNVGDDRPRDTIGFNMGYAAYSRWNLESVWGRVRSSYQALKTHGYKVSLVSCWPNDNVWYEHGLPNEQILQIGLSYKSIASLSSIKVMVPFRGHLGVTAACTGSTVCPIVFSSKVTDMYRGTDVFGYPITNEDKWFDCITKAYNTDVDNKLAIDNAKAKVSSMIAMFCDNLLERV